MTGKGRADRNKDFEITTNKEEEKPEGEKKETEQEHPSEDIGSNQCAALGTILSDISGILEYCLDDDERTASEDNEQAEAVHSKKSRKVKKSTAVNPLLRRDKRP